MFNHRLVVLLVERIQDDDAPFSRAVSVALREYVEALDKDHEHIDSSDLEESMKPNVVNKACVEFETSNHCIIRAIAGRETFFNQ